MPLTPTALSPFAAAAITGGNPFRTTMLTWKYTAPAFVVPLMFTLTPRGMGVLLQGSATDIVWATLSAFLGVVALAVGLGGWMRQAAAPWERALAVAAGALLFVPQPSTTLAGATLLATVTTLHWRRTRPNVPNTPHLPHAPNP